MCALLRKALLLKAADNAATDALKNNFTVLKGEKSQKGTVFEPPTDVFCDKKGNYALAVTDGQNVAVFCPCTKTECKTAENFELKEGFAAAIFDLDKTPPRLLLYGSSLKERFPPERLEKALSEKYADKGTDEKKSAVVLTATDLESSKPTVYDDEAVAEDNYYETAAKGKAKEETFAPIKESDDDLSHTVFDFEPKSESKKSEAESADCARQNDEDNLACPLEKTLPAFYGENEREITSIFKKYPPIAPLSDLIRDSRWVKIPYKNGAFYLFGEITRGGVPSYLVYGVCGKKSEKPKGFYSYSHFIPCSPYSGSDDGFWCAFQRTDNGKLEN